MYAIEFSTTILDGKIEIPAKYMSQFSTLNKVKVILMMRESPFVQLQNTIESDFGFGILSRYANSALWEQESNAWERAALEKHEAN